MLFSCLALCSFSATAVAQNSSLAEFEAAKHAPSMNWEAKPPYHAKPEVSVAPKGYSPAQISYAYQFYQLPGNGTGQKIAIIDAYGSPTIQHDLDTFCTTFGVPKTTLNILYPQGKVSRIDSGWALETSLDVEWAHAIAPGAQIMLVVTRSASFSDLLAGIDYAIKAGANEVSMSWGSSEFSGESFYDTHFNKAGVFFTASSGDNGSGVSWPASSPYVIGVGGTTLKLDSSGNVISEVAWKGSGGGVSKYVARPSYQDGWNTKTGRGSPDVSYAADPATGFAVYLSNLYSANGWIQVGGTSAGAPQWAALVAIANGFHTFGTGNSAVSSLYIIGGMDYNYFYRDVTAGSNGGYTALARYDFVTGLGSPFADTIVLQLGKY